MKFLVLSALAGTSLMLWAAGCGCTDMSCDTGVEIKTTAALGNSYSVEIETEDDTLSVACDVTDGPLQFGVVTGTSSPDVYCNLDGIFLFSMPEDVKVRFLDEDGTQLGRRSTSPDYEDLNINGDFTCGTTCTQATVVVRTDPAATPNGG
ncbi:MAG: hypothetical protein HOV80_08330 [Polyangiaceae bacterium]|nr:hypothetical protein [Polyangiaceae bacterium]